MSTRVGLRSRVAAREVVNGRDLSQTAKLNDVDPQAWLADVLARLADHPIHRLDDLLTWNWFTPSTTAIAA